MSAHVFISTRRAVSRRHFLRNAGIGLGLPLLDAMIPAFSRAEALAPPRRMLAICNNLGLLPENFFPSLDALGRGYQLSPYLEEVKTHREDFTVISGASHPDVDSGHPTDNCFLTAAPRPGGSAFRNTISLDQFAAERLGHCTRFPSLTFGVNIEHGSRSLSWTNAGVLIPCDEKPSSIFARLFLRGSAAEIREQERKLLLGQSIMDAVAGQTKSLQRNLGSHDRERLDQYFTGVRDLERRLGEARVWEKKPKPLVKREAPVDQESPSEYMDKVKLMYEMARLAFETDSTRLITLMLDSVNSPVLEIDGTEIMERYHNLTHHGQSEEKITQLESIDRMHMKLLNGLFSDFKSIGEQGGTLLDHSMVLYGSNLGNANTHVNTNLPILFAGGGFRHGQHLAFDRERNYPLSNLFVSILQRLGVQADAFASSTGTMRGLEVA